MLTNAQEKLSLAGGQQDLQVRFEAAQKVQSLGSGLHDFLFVLEKLAAIFLQEDANRLTHLPSRRAQDLEAAEARNQQRDAAVAGYPDALGKAVEGLQFETGEIDALQLFGGIQLASGPSVGRTAPVVD